MCEDVPDCKCMILHIAMHIALCSNYRCGPNWTTDQSKMLYLLISNKHAQNIAQFSLVIFESVPLGLFVVLQTQNKIAVVREML